MDDKVPPERPKLALNTIHCMDCIEGMKQMEDNSVDLILTDPPYNTGMVERKNSAKLNSFFNDNLTKEEYEDLMMNSIFAFKRILKPNKPIYMFSDYKSLWKLQRWLKLANFRFKQLLVWDKQIHGLNYQNYAHQVEYILYFTKGDYWHKRKNFKTDLLSVQRVNSDNKVNHETVKPETLIRGIIEDNSNKNSVVLDPFMGSGTTAVAAKQLGRNFIGFEISQEYVDIANKRLEQKQLMESLDSFRE